MVDNREVYIYVLKHPDTLEIRYVGKTVRKLSRRLGNHIANAKGNKHNKHLSNWILRHSIEFKEAMSKRLKGIPLSKEHKSKIGLANKGIKQSEESKRKRSESIKLWWTKRKSIEDIVKS